MDALEQAANRLALYDAIGNKVGEVIDGLNSGLLTVAFQVGGVTTPLFVLENGFHLDGPMSLLFTTADCTGQAYLNSSSIFFPVLTIIAPVSTLWVTDRTQSFMNITTNSKLRIDGICEPTLLPEGDTVLPALELADLDVFTPPFTVR